jgi:CRP/FNR family cyclic AMP-dependent transcriptional regulator
MDSAPTPAPEVLGNLGLFGGLDEASLRVLSEELSARHAAPGDVVVTEGDTDAEMFVVLSGELEVMKERTDGHRVQVAMFGPGDWFGDMAILDVQPRSATVRALAPSELLVITAQDVRHHLYERDVRAYSLFVMNVARELSRRLRVANGVLAQVIMGMSGSIQP